VKGCSLIQSTVFGVSKVMCEQMISVEKKTPIEIFIFLPILALCIDLFTPYPIWKSILPAWIRWGSHFAVACMIVVCFFRMLVFNFIPRSIWFILAVSILWAFVALGHGQGVAATVWGIWLLFQFPFVCIFLYLQPDPPKRLPGYLRKFGLIVLGMQVFAQLLQYVSGVKPGDDLSGLFGRNGTGNAVIFAILLCCVFLGYWITTKRWIELVIALVFCTISSVLGEMKLFPMAITVIGLLAIILYAYKYRAPGKMFVFLILILIILISFVYLYSIIVPNADDYSILTFITDPAKLYHYLNSADRFNREGNIYTDIGRGYAVQLGWNSLQKDPVTLLFGYGIGTRSESQTLGTAGVVLTTGDLGLSIGTSMLVMMQEMGLLGLAVLGALILWIVASLVHDIREKPNSLALELRYALLLFSVLWPVWLLYATCWTMRVPMLLYWLSLGYVLAESRISQFGIK
jgi:hypothetical protein